MTVTEVTKVKNYSYVGGLMRKFINNRCCLGVLRFFAAHPSGRFSRLAVVHAIDEAGSRLEVENALDRIVEEGILEMNMENDTDFYTLTGDKIIRQTVLNMGMFEWRDWQMVLEHI
jgi:hypothetical protein